MPGPTPNDFIAMLIDSRLWERRGDRFTYKKQNRVFTSRNEFITRRLLDMEITTPVFNDFKPETTGPLEDLVYLKESIKKMSRQDLELYKNMIEAKKKTNNLIPFASIITLIITAISLGRAFLSGLELISQSIITVCIIFSLYMYIRYKLQAIKDDNFEIELLSGVLDICIKEKEKSKERIEFFRTHHMDKEKSEMKITENQTIFLLTEDK